jgi:hypothetical protein
VAIKADASGRYLLTGNTRSEDFPLVGPIQPTYGGGQRDAFVTALASDGASLDYSTFLGGEDVDRVLDLVVDSSGRPTLVGSTQSVAFPTTVGAYQEDFAGGINACGDPPFDPLHNCPDVFVTRLDADGSAFTYSTYLGGTDEDLGRDVALDDLGRAYVIGYSRSDNFPPDGLVSPTSLYVSRLGADGATLDYTLEFDTISPSSGHGISIHTDGDIFITGADNVPADIYVARLHGEAPVQTLHVESIRARLNRPAAPYQIRADVHVADEAGAPLSGADVTVELALPGGDLVTLNATTNEFGRAPFDLSSPGSGSGTLCVTEILLAGYDYDPADNNLTCLDVIFP